MGLENLRNGYLSLTQAMYEPANAYKRIKHFLQIYEAPRIKTARRVSIQLGQLPFIFRILWYLGFIQAEKKYFWKLVRWSLTHKPANLQLAVVYSMMIHQTYRSYLRIAGKYCQH